MDRNVETSGFGKKASRIALGVGGLLLFAACPAVPSPVPTPTVSESTPPGFTQVKVFLEPPLANINEFDISTADVNRTNLASNISIHLIATAGDPESGIRTLTAVSELRWQCSSGHGSPIIGILETTPLPFASAAPPTPLNLSSIDTTVNPVATTGCGTPSPGWGPVNIEGFVRVTATNGAGLSTTSKTFLFDYADVGTK